MIQRTLLPMILLACSVLGQGSVFAGVGPENVIVVVNADSYESRTLANQYAESRGIPSINMIFLKGVSTKLVIGLEPFKAKILKPVLAAIETRGLIKNARVIAYSAKFPTTVVNKAHTDMLTNKLLKDNQKPRASINGLTYLYRFVLADNPQYLSFKSNLYCRGLFNRHFSNPFGDKDRRQRFKIADQAFRTGDFDQAADEFEKLFAKSPGLFPLAIRAAEARAENREKVAAKHLIVKAISAGWTSATWLNENDALAPLMKEPPLLALASRLSSAPIARQEPVGFSSQTVWTSTGHRGGRQDQGVPYMMSCMLGVVDPRGSDLQQAVDVLKRAVKGDQTNPDAAFWFMLTKNVRTKTRAMGMLDAMTWLTHLKRKNAMKTAVVPIKDRGLVAGLMLGTATMSFTGRRWQFVPGAIADNLTSHGGNFMNANQTKMTELLHAGAAMTSGTVTEPFAIQAKFPLPIMYGYFASGVTAIEAFYLSVDSPYQLLIAGDPLAQPYSQPPSDAITIKGVVGKQQGPVIEVNRTESPDADKKRQAGAMEIYLEGKLAKRGHPVQKLKFILPKNLKGSVEFRTVLIGRDTIQPRASHTHWIDFGDPAKIPKATPNDKSSSVSVQCEGADSIELMHHHESMGSIDGSSGKFSIDSNKWGGGPVRVRPVAKFGDQLIAGRPVIIQLPIVVKAAP